MWKEALLQGLIALLPVFLFLVWYDRPVRARYTPLFLSFCCGAAMILNLLFSVPLEPGMRIDLRMVPLLVGSLFGGLPAAVFLSFLYAVYRYSQVHSIWQFVYLSLFLAAFVPPLLHFSTRYRRLPRSRRLRIGLFFMSIFCFFLIVTLAVDYGSQPASLFWADLDVIAVFFAVYLCAFVAAIKFMELGFDRVRLQTELQEMSQKYRAEMRRLQEFIDQAPLSVIFLDGSGKITHINEACLRLIHPAGRKDVLFHSYRVFSGLLNLDKRSPIDRVIGGEERVVEMIRFQGKTLYTVTSVVKGTSGPSSDGILFIGHDVTELQQLRDELGRMERLSLVGQMAASITHEIRNPMAVIRGFVQLLNERSSSDQQSYFRIVMEELDRANGIINDFLSLAQNRIVEKDPASLHDVLNEMMPLISADANMRGQAVELNLCEQIEPIEINSKEIKQLVLNLARNGMEAMGDRGVLTMETVNLADSVQLRVTDNGVGIPKEKLERLFEPFYTTKTNGTGLGLPLCLSIVERHNGKIQVESEVGKGTTFIVSFSKPRRAYRS